MSIDRSLFRCDWCLNSFDEYIIYHDREWGVPVHNDRDHFEFLILEGAQAGLSWSTILKKREGYRQAFAGFDPEIVARFNEANISKLLADKNIVRNRLKIRSVVNNAGRFLEIQERYGTFDRYIWDFVDGKPVINQWKSLAEVPPSTALSDTISKDLRQKGFSFAGTTIIYAHMQATGIVNDHLITCFRHKELV